MRIRGYDEETEEYIGGVEELSGKVADLTKTAKTPGGISLFTDANKTEYKSTLQLFEEISEIYGDLSDKNQAQLLEVLGGKHNGNALSAIFTGFDTVRESLDAMANSSGNAEEEFSIALDSVEHKMNALKETGVGIFQNLFQREDIKGVIDVFTNVLEVVDAVTEKLGLFGTAAAGGGIFAAVKSIA